MQHNIQILAHLIFVTLHTGEIFNRAKIEEVPHKHSLFVAVLHLKIVAIKLVTCCQLAANERVHAWAYFQLRYGTKRNYFAHTKMKVICMVN